MRACVMALSLVGRMWAWGCPFVLCAVLRAQECRLVQIDGRHGVRGWEGRFCQSGRVWPGGSCHWAGVVHGCVSPEMAARWS